MARNQMGSGVFTRGRGLGRCLDIRARHAGQITGREQQTESYANVADDFFDFAEKAQLFSSSSPYPSDCVITLKDDKEVHVQRSLLALHSKYFKEKFEEDNCDSIDLDIIDHDEFVELLCVIYPSVHPITARNVETISKLAYGFEMPALLKRCDVFLMANNKKLSRSKLLLIAQEYDMRRLQEHYVKEYKYVEDVKAIQNEPEYASLNYQTRRMLLDNIIETQLTTFNSLSYMPSSNEYFDETFQGNSQIPVNLKAKQAGVAKILEALSSSTDCSPDIVLVVGDRQIEAHKQYLSVYSRYFNAMFQNDFKEGRENVVELEGIGYGEILELLTVVYPTEYPITGLNIATILKLADRFLMPAILARCKKALKRSSTIKGALKLWCAQRYNFDDLQEEFAREYKTIADVMRIKAEPEFEELDDKTRALILDSITQQNRWSQCFSQMREYE
ncbi:BTB/POZ domain-containing protein [Ditylenchus destructor]|nr:BTB/POZ domain-containing protein [Ditylenchus destructor]